MPATPSPLRKTLIAILMDNGESFMGEDGTDERVCRRVASEIESAMVMHIRGGGRPKPLVRIVLTGQMNNQAYIWQTRDNDWHCTSVGGTPWAWSNVGIRDGMAAMFALEQSTTADEALAIVRAAMDMGHGWTAALYK